MAEEQRIILPTRQYPTPHPALLIESMPVKWLEIRLASAEHCEQTRKEYDANLLRDFRNYAFDQCRQTWSHLIQPEELAAITQGYHVHHKLPVSFGGTNKTENLILIAPYAHKAIHRRMERIINDFKELKKDYDQILIPQPAKYALLKKMKEIKGLHISHAHTGIRAFIKFPCPEGAVYIPHLATNAPAIA